jgi:hypothetical protein
MNAIDMPEKRGWTGFGKEIFFRYASNKRFVEAA